MIYISNQNKSNPKPLPASEKTDSQPKNGTPIPIQANVSEPVNIQDTADSRTTVHTTHTSSSSEQMSLDRQKSLPNGSVDHDVPDTKPADADTQITPFRNKLREHIALKPSIMNSRKKHASNRHAHLAESDDLAASTKAFLKAAKRFVSEASNLSTMDEQSQLNLASLLKKVRSKNDQIEKNRRKLESLSNDIDKQEKKLNKVEREAFKLSESILFGESHRDLIEEQSNETTDSSVIDVSEAESMHPLLSQLYDKIGDAKLIGEEIFNLQAEYRLQRMFRDSDKREGGTPSIPDTDFYLDYFSKREGLLQRFSESKEAALDYYAQCIKENLEVEEFDLPPLDHNDDRQESVHLETQELQPAAMLGNPLLPMLLEFGLEPISIEEWRTNLPIRFPLLQIASNSHSQLIPEQNANEASKAKFKKSSRPVSIGEGMIWEIISSIKSNFDEEEAQRQSRSPSRGTQHTSFHERDSRFVGEPVSNYYSEPELKTSIKVPMRRRTRSASPRSIQQP